MIDVEGLVGMDLKMVDVQIDNVLNTVVDRHDLTQVKWLTYEALVTDRLGSVTAITDASDSCD